MTSINSIRLRADLSCFGRSQHGANEDGLRCGGTAPVKGLAVVLLLSQSWASFHMVSHRAPLDSGLTTGLFVYLLQLSRHKTLVTGIHWIMFIKMEAIWKLLVNPPAGESSKQRTGLLSNQPHTLSSSIDLLTTHPRRTCCNPNTWVRRTSWF